jgi:predicted nucleic acid-binding protein
MPKTIYDTRFFLEHYYSQETTVLKKTKEAIRKVKERFISAIVLHEIYWLTLEQEGREMADLRTDLLEKDFKVVQIDGEIAKSSAELRYKYQISLTDSIVAATALMLKAICLSDDPHFKAVGEIKTAWI